MKKITLFFVALFTTTMVFADYYIVGTSELCGSAWSVEDNNYMVYDETTNAYTITYHNLPQGQYEFVVCRVEDGKITDWIRNISADCSTKGYIQNYNIIFKLSTTSDVTIKYLISEEICLTSTNGFYFDDIIDGIYYYFYPETKTATVTYNENYMNSNNPNYNQSEIIIPGTVICNDSEYKVTSIGNRAFYNCTEITSISIGENINSIENYAFEGCTKLTSVYWNAINCKDFSSENTLWDYSNYGYTINPITSIIFGDSVKYIPAYLCYNMETLTSIEMSNNITSIGESAFSGCEKLTSVTISESLTEIDTCVFAWCESLTEIIIPNSVTSIKSWAFDHCSSLSSIKIPSSITSIEGIAFQGCENLSIYIKDIETWLNISFGKPTKPSSIMSPSFGSWECPFSSPYKLYVNNELLTNLIIPEGIDSIRRGTFQQCSSLNYVVIPNTVTKIGERAFASCKSLIEVTIPNSIIEIDHEAFSGSRWLTNQPDGCLYIGKCFYQYIGEMPTNTHIDIKNGTTQICANAFDECKNLSSITIPNSVTSIGAYAFNNCQNLPSLIIPSSVTKIGGYVFTNCNSLTSITCLAPIPPTTNNLGIENYFSCTLFVPKNSLLYYVNHEEWGKFTHIKEITATSINNTTEQCKKLYTINNTLHIEGATTDYHILDTAGRLIYSGNATTLTLPRGIYLITINGEVEKIVL